jgi:beta-lactamase superfamily II metal-dependent hydrolase
MRLVRQVCVSGLFTGLIALTVSSSVFTYGQGAQTSVPNAASQPSATGTAPTAQTPRATLRIIHFDVGNGDATLIILETPPVSQTATVAPSIPLVPIPNSLLIDGGAPAQAAKVVIPGIKAEHLTMLDFVIATHYAREHRDGLVLTTQAIPMSGLGVFYDRDRGWPSERIQGGTMKTVENRPLQPGSTITLGKDSDQVLITCVAANGNTADWRSGSLDENALSLAFVIKFHDFKYFIGGDLTGGGRSGWAPTPDIETRVARDVGEVAVLRVNHHGSDTSSNQAFLAALNPTVAVISTGRDPWNDRLFHWPSRKVLDRLNRMPHLSAVYVTGDVATSKGLTDEDKKKVKPSRGTVTISTTGTGTFNVNGTSFSLK